MNDERCLTVFTPCFSVFSVPPVVIFYHGDMEVIQSSTEITRVNIQTYPAGRQGFCKFFSLEIISYELRRH